MNTIRGKIETDLQVTEDLDLVGMVVGKMVITNQSCLYLHGMVIGEVTVEKGSRLYLHGMVNGDVINLGGRTDISGMVNGKVIQNEGDIFVDPKAIIRDGIVYR